MSGRPVQQAPRKAPCDGVRTGGRRTASPGWSVPVRGGARLALAAALLAGVTPALAQMATPAPQTRTDLPPRLAPGPAAPTAGLLRPLSPGEQLVVVRGFRIRSTVFANRIPALEAGFASTAVMAECDAGPCGFVVLRTDEGYRYTSVVTGSTNELLAMARDMERDDLSLVIVYPPASRLRSMYAITEGQLRELRAAPGGPAAAPAGVTGARPGGGGAGRPGQR